MRPILVRPACNAVVLTTVLTFVLPFAVLAQEGPGTVGARLRYGAVVALALGFTWSLSVWNLLGWSL